MLQHHHTQAPGPPPGHPTYGQPRTLQRAKEAWDHVESPLPEVGCVPLAGANSQPCRAPTERSKTEREMEWRETEASEGKGVAHEVPHEACPQFRQRPPQEPIRRQRPAPAPPAHRPPQAGRSRHRARGVAAARARPGSSSHQAPISSLGHGSTAWRPPPAGHCHATEHQPWRAPGPPWQRRCHRQPPCRRPLTATVHGAQRHQRAVSTATQQ